MSSYLLRSEKMRFVHWSANGELRCGWCREPLAAEEGIVLHRGAGKTLEHSRFHAKCFDVLACQSEEERKPS